ncbi:MAG: ATP-dependent DNA helicase [Microgenomates group bacterium GW2011_GWC1_41_8]|nr:MAG: ATP-dependent DNA helicase [Microgenomates group bacterium GW2011_GWC1_41_8]
MHMNLATPISQIPGIGPVYVKRLEKLNIFSVKDLLEHYPFRYEDYSLITLAAQAQVGETVTIRGTIHSAKNEFTRNGKQMQKIQLFDGTGSMLLVFFNQPYLLTSLTNGTELAASGTVSFFGRNKAMISPEYEQIFGRDPIHTGRLVPIYPETAGVSSKWLRSKIALLLKRMGNDVEEFLPQNTLNSQNLMGYKSAINQIHFPESQEQAGKARERLAFDELFLTQLASQIRKRQWKEEKTTYQIRISKHEERINEFIKNLPFTLTGAQKRCIKEILSDLSQSKPMNRLLQGDVGSGKTVVAAIAMYATHLSGYKSVLMAPTEILAQQHFRTINNLLGSIGLTVGLITGSRNRKSLNGDDKPDFDVIVGTHALLYNQDFENLALVIIDEQHRFGVEQRARLKQKGIHPHLLSMTATPIPRSVALVIHSELDLSYIDEMPLGRKLIKTWLVPNEKREKAYEWIRKQLKPTTYNLQPTTYNQAFIICPLIEESDHESLQSVKAVTVEFERLQKKVFRDLKLGLLHGRIKSKEKEEILAKMNRGALDMLVATPVVEVGIDIPNATIMVIEAAERFGLAQLHQLRGRVGRNDKQSYCLLFTESTRDTTQKRLRYLESINNGAELAEIDMKLRGPGELFGTRQSGYSEFKLASLTDTALITKVRISVSDILRKDVVLAPGLHDRIQNYIIQSVNPD